MTTKQLIEMEKRRQRLFHQRVGQTEDGRLGVVLAFAFQRAAEKTQETGPSQTRCARRQRERLAADPRFAAEVKQRAFFAAMFRTKNSTPDRISRFVEMTGKTPAEMRAHIEAQFGLGMSWENRSAWHIDHVRPCCTFDLLKPCEVRRCWNWRNLRPLLKEENQGKARYDVRLKKAEGQTIVV